MKTFILPGNSSGNQEWLDYLKHELSGLDTQFIQWPHWQTGNEADFVVEQQAKVVADQINGNQVNILAKSIGTLITMLLLLEHHVKINKLILCGIPVQGFKEGDAAKYVQALKDFDAEHLLCVQNAQDPWGSFAEVETFVHGINPKIRIIEKSAANHAYPYADDFKKLLL
jgi:predicted alpha/beta-hydrolase family hydrolase